MINYKHKFIFVGIPKSGTTSMSSQLPQNDFEKLHGWDELNNKWKQHYTISELTEYGYFTNEELAVFLKFAFVRNPWDRTLSGVHYRKKVGGSCYKNYTIKDYLNGFTTKTNCHDKLSINQHIRPQYEFVFDETGNNLMDFIGRFENLQEDFNVVCDKIGIPRQELPHKNKSKHKHYTEYYDDETREIIAEKYAKDIEYFGYKFGE